MADKKSLKRSVKAVWDEVKALRSEHGKNYAAADVLAAADALAGHARRLSTLGKQISALSAMPIAKSAGLAGKSKSKKKQDVDDA